MSNKRSRLKSRIHRLSSLTGHAGDAGKSILDGFLLGALVSLYSRKLGKDPNPSLSEDLTSAHSVIARSATVEGKNEAYDVEFVNKIVSTLDGEIRDNFYRGFYTAKTDKLLETFSPEAMELARLATNQIEKTNAQATAYASTGESGDGIDVVGTQLENESFAKKSSEDLEVSDVPPSEETRRAAGEGNITENFSEIADSLEEELNELFRLSEGEEYKISDSIPDGLDSEFINQELTFLDERNSDEIQIPEKIDIEIDGAGVSAPELNERLDFDPESVFDLAQLGKESVVPDGVQEQSASSGAAAGAQSVAVATSTPFVVGSFVMLPLSVGYASKANRKDPVQEDSQPIIEEPPIIVVPELEQPTSPEEPDVEEPVVVLEPSVEEESSDSGGASVAAAAAAPLGFVGRVVDGYVVGATVFYDENNNGILDDSESQWTGVTNADGTFQLPDFSAADPGGAVVILPGGIDTNTGHEIGMLQVNVPKDASGNPILSDVSDGASTQASISSPLTLILAQNSDIVEEDLIAQLGMTGVEETGLAYYDPVAEMEAGNNNNLAEYVFTVQQQLFSVIQAASKIAGSTAGLSALSVSVKAVGDAIKTALDAGTALTVDTISSSAITAVANASGYSSIASGLATIVQATNEKIADAYSGMAAALLDPTDSDSITLLSSARATAAASQDTLLTTISTAVESESLDTSAFTAALESAISENSAVFGTLLTAESGSGSSGTSEFGNPSFIVSKLLEQTGSDTTRDIVDLSSSINTLSLAQLSELGVQHVRLLGTNSSVEISLGSISASALSSLNDDATSDDVSTTLVDESSVDDGLFASNYAVTLKVTDAEVQSVVTNASVLRAAGIDTIKPVEGSLTLTLSQVRELQDLGFSFASGLVRFSASSSDSLTFDEIYTLLNSGLKLTDASTVTVTLPDNDSRSTFTTANDLAARGVAFDGGTIVLEAADVKGSFTVLQAKLLDAANSNIVFDTSGISSWSLGKTSAGVSLGSPEINATDIAALIDAGLTFNSATLVVADDSEVSGVVSRAFDILNAGIDTISFASGVSISTDDARTILEAKDLTVSQGKSYSDVIFSGGTLSNLGSVSLQSLSDLLEEGLGLDTSFVPQFSDALALVQLGITFPQGITLQTSTSTIISNDDATSLVSAGVSFQGSYSFDFVKDGSLSEAENLSSLLNFMNSGLVPNLSNGTKISLSGTSSNPLYVTTAEKDLLKDYVTFDAATLVLMRSSDFSSVFGDLTTNASTWSSQSEFTKLGVPLSVTPNYSHIKDLASVNSSRSLSDGLQPISIQRIAKSSDTFTDLDSELILRISKSADLDTVSAVDLKNSGVDKVDVLGVPLSVSQAEKFLSNSAPILTNAKLLIDSSNISEAATLTESSSGDRTIFGAGIDAFSIASGTSATADQWKRFSDVYDSVPEHSASTKIFEGVGTITGAGSLSSGVGLTLSRLSTGGLKLSDTYSPSLAEVDEFVSADNIYTKGIKISLQEGETLTAAKAIELAEANVSFTENTPLDFSGQTASTLASTLGSSEADHVTKFLSLIQKGFKLENVDNDLLTLSGVTFTTLDDFNELQAKGFIFSGSKITVTNKMEFTSASIKLMGLENHGISHLIVPNTLKPSFGEAKKVLDSGVAFETSSGSLLTIKANAVSQLDSLANKMQDLETMGVGYFDLEGLSIPLSTAELFVESAANSSITFLNSPNLYVESSAEFSEVSSKASQLYSLGINTIELKNGISIGAKEAYDIVTNESRLSFTGGEITDSNGIETSSLKNVLTTLKEKGLPVSSTFKPSIEVELTGSDQADAEQLCSMIIDGFRLLIPGGETLNLENVFLSKKNFELLAIADNYGTGSAKPSFQSSYVVVKNSRDIDNIVSDLARTDSSLTSLGVDRVAVIGEVSPSLTQVQGVTSKSLSFSRFTKDGSEYLPISGDSGLIGLKATANDVTSIAENAQQIFDGGVKKLSLFGQKIALSDAENLVAAGFTFEGGSLSSISDAEKNTLSYLDSIATAGLGLPLDVSVRNSTISLDFAMNKYRGSLEGATVELASADGSDSISLEQALRLVNRDLGTNLEDSVLAFQNSRDPDNLMVSLETTSKVSSTLSSKLANLGLNGVSGEASPSAAAAFASESLNFDMQQLKVKGLAKVSELTSIFEKGNLQIFDGVTLESNSISNLTDIIALLADANLTLGDLKNVDSSKLNVSGLQLSDAQINVENISLAQELGFILPNSFQAVGVINNLEDIAILINISGIDLSGVLLKSLDGPIISNAQTLANIAELGVQLNDGIHATVLLSDQLISVGDALILDSAGVDLSEKGLLANQSTNAVDASRLLNIEDFQLDGLHIVRSEPLDLIPKAEIFEFNEKGVSFTDILDGKSNIGVLEASLDPFEALSLFDYGMDLSGKTVTSEVVVPDSIGLSLNQIPGLRLTGIEMKHELLSDEQVGQLNDKGVNFINAKPQLVADDLGDFGRIVELSEKDPFDEAEILSISGNVGFRDADESDFPHHEVNISEFGGGYIGNLSAEIRYPEIEISLNSSQTSGDAFSDTSEPLEVAGELAQVFWEYSVDGEEVEYLAENEVSTQEYTLHIADRIAQLTEEGLLDKNITIEIVGTDDTPEISFDDDSDVNGLISERAGDSQLEGSINLFDRDLSDTLRVTLAEPTIDSETHYEAVGQTTTSSIMNENNVSESYDAMTELKTGLQEVVNFNLVNISDVGNQDGVFVSELSPGGEIVTSGGNYMLSWTVGDTSEFFSSFLTSSDEISVDYEISLSDEKTSVSQTISLDFIANRAPALIDDEGLVPNIQLSGKEDIALELSPEDFGLSYFVDPDVSDRYTSVRIESFSEQSELTAIVNKVDDVENIVFSPGDTVDISQGENGSQFSLEGASAELFYLPSEDMHGNYIISFSVGDGDVFSDTSYEIDVFFEPVVDQPFISISKDPSFIDDVEIGEVNFLNDLSTLNFAASPKGQNSSILETRLDITQAGVLLDSKTFEQNDDEWTYELSIVDLAEMQQVDNYELNAGQVEYSIVNSVQANLVVAAKDNFEDFEDINEFRTTADFLIIPDLKKVQQEEIYRDAIFGSDVMLGKDSFSESVEEEVMQFSNFSNAGGISDVSFIDPTFEKVVSTDPFLDGELIEFDAESIHGTRGFDVIVANSSMEYDSGTLIYGGGGVDIIIGSDHQDIIYVDGDKAAESSYDTVAGGNGSDVFVLAKDDFDDIENYSLDDTDKSEMDMALDVLLEDEGVQADGVNIVGLIEDWSVSDSVGSDSLVIAGFDESSTVTVHGEENFAAVLVEEETSNTYTAAILMPEFGVFDADEMDAINNAVHKI